MKNPHFDITRRMEREYEKAINAITRRVLAKKSSEQTLESWLNDLARKSTDWEVREASKHLAQKMVAWVNVRNVRTWRQAASRSQRSIHLFNLFQQEMSGPVGARATQLVRENAQYISSISFDAANVLVDEIRKAEANGARPETIAKMMRTRFPKLLRSRTHLIARTESAKVSAALTRARSEALNLKFYLWLTSRDGRVRASHKNMNLVLIPWSHPPSPEALAGEHSTLGHYHAGECPNCRCTQEVVLDLSDVSWPHRVYWGGRLAYMTRVQVEKLAA